MLGQGYTREAYEREIASWCMLQDSETFPPELERLVTMLKRRIAKDSLVQRESYRTKLWSLGYVLRFPRRAFREWQAAREVSALKRAMPRLDAPVRPDKYGASGWSRKQVGKYNEFAAVFAPDRIL